MARLRCKVTLPWTTNLPEDVTVNTLHFTTASSPSTGSEHTEIFLAVEAVYNTASGVAGTQISGYLSNLVSRVAGACTMELYDLADAVPRIPVATSTFTMGAADEATTGAPEVALCLSFQADPISGVPQARRRGRIYLGPLTQGVVTTTGRPANAVVDAVAAAGNFLVDSLQGASPVRWTVYSRVGDAMAEVTNGWCDNEFDTMRSRGRLSTYRALFAA
jgi:hypothetical protein